MRISVRQRISLWVGLPILLVYLLIFSLALWKLREVARESAEHNMESLVRLAAAKLDGEFRQASQVAASTASFLDTHPDTNPEQVYAQLRANVERNDLVYGSATAFEPYAFRPDLKLFSPYVCRDGPGLKQIDIGAESYDYTSGKWDWWTAPREAEKALWTEPYFDEGAGNILMSTYSAPFYRDKKFWGITTIDIALEPISAALNAQFSQELDFVIVSRPGNYIYHPDHKKILNDSIKRDAGQNIELAGLARRLTTGESGAVRIAEWEGKTNQIVFYTALESTGWGFAARLSEKDVTAPVAQLMWAVSGTLAGSLVVIILGVWLIAGRLTRPFDDAEAAARLTAGMADIHQELTRNRIKILFSSIVIMGLIALFIGLIANALLYDAAFGQRKRSLGDLADSQARIFMTRFKDIQSKAGSIEKAVQETVKDIREKHEYFSMLGETGEFDLARRKGDRIEYLVQRRSREMNPPLSIPLSDPGIDEPMRKAIRGESGVNVLRDQRGTLVLASYRPATGLDMGMVTKVDMAEIRRPFLHAGAITLGAAALLIALGGMALVWTVSPLLKRVEESEKQFRTLVRNIPGVTYRCRMDADWTMLFISDAVEDLTGYLPSDFIQNRVRTFDSVIHPDDREQVSDGVLAAANRGVAFTLEYRVIHANRTVRWVREKGQPVRDGAGEVAWLDGAIFDITDRKLAEIRLKESEEQTRAIVETAADGVLTLDEEGDVEFVNAAARRMFDLREDEIIGCGVNSLIPQPAFPDLKNSIEHDASSDGPYVGLSLETHGRRKDGSSFPLQLAISRWSVGERRRFTGIIRDITDQKNVEGALRRAREDADSANRAKSAFLASMSHEIRTPMNAIINMAALALDTELDNKQRQYLKVVNSSARSLLDLINDILDFSKIEAGRMDVEKTPFALRELLEDITLTFRDRVMEKRIEFVVTVAPEVPRTVVGDSLRLRQVLLNLIGNAFKFTDTGEIAVRVGARDPADAAPTDDRTLLLFSVRDTGIGIPPGKQPSLFQAFVQADNSISRKYGGTGLGLAISQRLVKLMGGQGLILESEPGRGSLFSFSLPVEIPPGSAGAAWTVPSEIRNLRALVVDDNVTTRELFETILQGFHIRCASVAGAEEALAALRYRNTPKNSADAFHFVLIDWQLEGLDGLQTAERIRADEALRELPLILTSAYAGRDELARAESLGVDAFVPKPITPSSLLDAIMEAMRATTAAQPEPREEAVEGEFQNVPVLLAEDNKANQFVAQEILRLGGFSIDNAEDGREAVEKIMSREYALVLMDVQMPEMDGLEATRIVRRKRPRKQLPIVAMTANAMRGDMEECLEAGMDDYVAKPVDRVELFRVLRKWLPPESRRKWRSDPERATPAPSSRAEPRAGESIPSLRGIDLAEALSRLGLPYKAFERLLLRFGDEQGETMAKMREAVARGDAKAARLHAHSLAGAASNIAAGPLAKSARAMELAARDESEDWESHLAGVEEESAVVRDSIAGLAHRETPLESPGAPPEDGRAFFERLESLRQPLAQLDLDGVTAALRDLRNAGPPETLRCEFARLEKMISGYEYDAALEILTRIAAKAKIP